jgi:Na+-transporting methylmalonyl-CoA/oxaloacetate decarboxylase beta subunit
MHITDKEDPTHFILMQSVSANLAGQPGSIAAGGMLLAAVRYYKYN